LIQDLKPTPKFIETELVMNTKYIATLTAIAFTTGLVESRTLAQSTAEVTLSKATGVENSCRSGRGSNNGDENTNVSFLSREKIIPVNQQEDPPPPRRSPPGGSR